MGRNTDQTYMPEQIVQALRHLQPDEILMGDSLEGALKELDASSTDALGKLGLRESDLYQDECNAFRWQILFNKVQEARERVDESSAPMSGKLDAEFRAVEDQYAAAMQLVAESVNALALAAMRIVMMTLHFRPDSEVWPVWNDSNTSVLAARWPGGLEPSPVQRRLADLLGQLAADSKTETD